MEKLTKKTKILLWSSLMVALAVISIMVYRRLKAEKGYTDTRPAQYNCKQARSASFPLKYGAIGWQVELLQRICNNCPDFGLQNQIATDGIWGHNTETAFMLCFAKNLISETDFEQLFNFYKQYTL